MLASRQGTTQDICGHFEVSRGVAALARWKMGAPEPKVQRQKLQSWKEIAAFLGKDVRTARRWNAERGLPVHRVPGGKGASVFAYIDELEAWFHERPSEEPSGTPDSEPSFAPDAGAAPADGQADLATLSSRGAPPLQTQAGTSNPVRRYARLEVLLGLAVLLAAGSYFAGRWLPLRSGVVEPVSTASQRHTLAVLPFANLSGDPSQQFFSDGLTEELISQLARLNPRGLGVIARTSVMRYQLGDKDIRQAGTELGVEWIVEGSVRRSGNRARITAQLIRVSDQTHVWANSFEGDVRDVLTMEAEVARAIASEIEVVIQPDNEKLLANPRAINPEAHDAYLRGIYFWNRRGDDDLEKAIQYFQLAVQIDPQYAEAHAGLAGTYVLVSRPRLDLTPVEAEKALSLDPTLGLPHAALGIYNYTRWDLETAEKEFQRALELNPGNPTAHHWHAYNLTVSGRQREAVEEMKRALQLDPLSLPLNRDLGLAYYWARDYDSAIAQFKKTLEMDPHFHHTHTYLGRAYERQGKYDLALKEYEQADFNPASISDQKTAQGRAYALMGRREDALRVLAELDAISRKNGRFVLPYNEATIYAALGDKDRTFQYLEADGRRHSGWLLFLPVDPQFDQLRSDPRYSQLIAWLHTPR